MGKSIHAGAELLLAVAKWAHRYQDDYPHLSAVYFRGTEMAATDGHRLVRVPLDCHGQEFSVRRADIFAAIAAQNAWHRHHSDFAMRLNADLEATNDGETIWAMGDRAIDISWDGGPFVLLDLDGCVLRCPVGTGTLPPIDSVMLPRRDGDVPRGHGFDIRYLAGVEEVVRAAGWSRSATVIEGWDDGELTPFQFSSPLGAPDEERIRFVIMPMARNGEEAHAEMVRRRRAGR